MTFYQDVHQVMFDDVSYSAISTCAKMIALSIPGSTTCKSLYVLVLASYLAYDGLSMIARLRRAMALHGELPAALFRSSTIVCRLIAAVDRIAVNWRLR
jgi:hypothetical protein